MNILYACDNEQSAVMPLDSLLRNFRDSRTEINESDIRHALKSRGWYEGLHDNGRYLIFNVDKFRHVLVRAGLRGEQS